LRYRELPDGARGAPEAARKDWRAELDEPGQRIYDELRLWRGRKAKREGMPPYLILNNRELAELAMRKPATLAKLREIDGIGEAKSARWGEEILALLVKLSAPPPIVGGGGNSWLPPSFPFLCTGRKLSGIFSPAPKNSPSGSASPYPRA
jgi:ribonuclease D